MAKQKKKRTKKYSGNDVALSKPNITRVQAVSRSRAGQWWFEKKRIVKPVLIGVAVVIVVIVLIIQVVQLVNGV